MKYLSAYVLATLGGNKDPFPEDVEKILSSVGFNIERENLNKVCQSLKGKKLDALMEEGKSKMATLATSAPAASSENSAAASKDDAQSKDVKPKEKEEKKEESEESDDDMGFGLFD